MTEDIGMDKNPRTIPARAAAQAGIVAGIVMTLIGVAALVLAVTSSTPVTLGRDVLVWPVAVGVAVAGVVSVTCAIILLRIVRERDVNRAASRIAGEPPR